MTKFIINTGVNLKILACVASIAGISCHNLPEKCGGGNYYCTGMTATHPFENPVKFVRPFFAGRILLADGRLITDKRIYNPITSEKVDSFVVYDLKAICQSDTICDMAILDEYGFDDDTILSSVLLPNRLCILLNFSIIAQEIGNSGPDTARLINASYAALDSFRNYYIIDTGDSTVKVFGPDGAFIRSFKAGIDPYRIMYYLDDNTLFVLDRADDSIRELTLNGEQTSRFINSSYLTDITAFNIFHGTFMIADMGGQRLTAISLTGNIIESKTDFCYQDLYFDFGKIISLDLDDFGPSLNISDRSRNLVLVFEDRLWDDVYYPRPTD